MSQLWTIYKKVDFVQLLHPLWLFLPLFGPNRHFPEKWYHHLKRLMVIHLYAKKYKKRLNGSKDIAIWKIEWSDWSRAFTYKSQEWEFSQIQDLHRKLANHNTLLFRSFLAKTNDSILHKIPKTLFLGLFGPFFPIFPKMRIFPKNRALHFWAFMDP